MPNNRINIFWFIIVCVYTFVHIVFIPTQWGQHAISDKGFLSFLTIILLVISLISVLRACSFDLYANYKLPMYALAYCILIYVLREADFHRLFTDEHITKSKFYKNPDISLQQKLFGGIPMLVFFICVFYLISKYTKVIAKHLFQLAPWAVAVFLWGLTFILSQAVDKSDLNDIYYGI